MKPFCQNVWGGDARCRRRSYRWLGSALDLRCIFWVAKSAIHYLIWVVIPDFEALVRGRSQIINCLIGILLRPFLGATKTSGPVVRKDYFSNVGMKPCSRLNSLFSNAYRVWNQAGSRAWELAHQAHEKVNLKAYLECRFWLISENIFVKQTTVKGHFAILTPLSGNNSQNSEQKWVFCQSQGIHCVLDT